MSFGFAGLTLDALIYFSITHSSHALGFRAVKGFLEQGAVLEQRRLKREANGGEVAAVPAPRTYKHVRPLSVYQEQLKLFTEEGSA